MNQKYKKSFSMYCQKEDIVNIFNTAFQSLLLFLNNEELVWNKLALEKIQIQLYNIIDILFSLDTYYLITSEFNGFDRLIVICINIVNMHHKMNDTEFMEYIIPVVSTLVHKLVAYCSPLLSYDGIKLLGLLLERHIVYFENYIQLSISNSTLVYEDKLDNYKDNENNKPVTEKTNNLLKRRRTRKAIDEKHTSKLVLLSQEKKYSETGIEKAFETLCLLAEQIGFAWDCLSKNDLFDEFVYLQETEYSDNNVSNDFLSTTCNTAEKHLSKVSPSVQNAKIKSLGIFMINYILKLLYISLCNISILLIKGFKLHPFHNISLKSINKTLNTIIRLWWKFIAYISLHFEKHFFNFLLTCSITKIAPIDTAIQKIFETNNKKISPIAYLTYEVCQAIIDHFNAFLTILYPIHEFSYKVLFENHELISYIISVLCYLCKHSNEIVQILQFDLKYSYSDMRDEELSLKPHNLTNTIIYFILKSLTSSLCKDKVQIGASLLSILSYVLSGMDEPTFIRLNVLKIDFISMPWVFSTMSLNCLINSLANQNSNYTINPYNQHRTNNSIFDENNSLISCIAVTFKQLYEYYKETIEAIHHLIKNTIFANENWNTSKTTVFFRNILKFISSKQDTWSYVKHFCYKAYILNDYSFVETEQSVYGFETISNEFVYLICIALYQYKYLVLFTIILANINIIKDKMFNDNATIYFNSSTVFQDIIELLIDIQQMFSFSFVSESICTYLVDTLKTSKLLKF